MKIPKIIYFVLFAVIIMLTPLSGFTQAEKQDSAISPYHLYMACVKPLVRLNETRRTYPGHIFIGYVIRNQAGLDSVIQYCGNQPASPLIKNIFTRRKGLAFGTIEGYMSMDESVYAKYRKVHILEIAVSREEYMNAIEIRNKWEKRKLLKVNGMDCVSFVEEVMVNALHFNPIHRSYFHNLIPIRYWKQQIHKNQNRLHCYSIYYCRMPIVRTPFH